MIHSPRPAHPLRSAGGFTLLELLIVLAIVALIAALVAPRIGSGEGAMFRAQVREAVAALNYARRSAIIQGRPTEALMQRAGGDPVPVVEGRWVNRGVTLSVLEGEAPSDGEAPFAVTFFPEGGSSGGVLSLRRGELSAEIRIDAITGRVKARIVGDTAAGESAG